MIQKFIELRKKLKSRKPVFKTHDSHKKKRVGDGWRRPKGRQNKMRLHRKGYARDCSTGFGSPAMAKGLSPTGLTQNIIHTLIDFECLEPSKDGIIISGPIGMKKKTELLDFAVGKGFKILNLNVDKFKETYNKMLQNKKEQKSKLNKKKTEKQKIAAKPKKETKSTESEKTEDQKGDNK
jgi:large subunit ribosomal protein L32e